LKKILHQHNERDIGGTDTIVYNILLVEDHEDWSTILEETIRDALEDFGHEDDNIEILQTFSEAHRALQDHHWNLMVTDIGLGDPTEVSQRLGRQLVRMANEMYIPVIAVSGTPIVSTQTVRNILIEDGAVDYFSKREFDPQKFINRVQDLLLLSQTTNRIQDLFSQFQQNDQLSPEEAQQKVAETLADQVRKDPEFKSKLIMWIKSFSDTASKAVISEAVKRIFAIALQLLN